MVKFMFSKKATIIDEIFAVNLALCSKCQIDGEDFVDFCGLLRKHELYLLCQSKGDKINLYFAYFALVKRKIISLYFAYFALLKNKKE